jgi:plastocyanin
LTTRRSVAVVLTVVFAAVFCAVPPPASAGGGAIVEIVEPDADNERTWAFRPATVTVTPGGTVTWRNSGFHTHNVIADDKAFDSGDILPGQSWSFTFRSAGEFPYHCGPHRWMRGSVQVVARS